MFLMLAPACKASGMGFVALGQGLRGVCLHSVGGTRVLLKRVSLAWVAFSFFIALMACHGRQLRRTLGHELSPDTAGEIADD